MYNCKEKSAFDYLEDEAASKVVYRFIVLTYFKILRNCLEIYYDNHNLKLHVVIQSGVFVIRFVVRLCV